MSGRLRGMVVAIPLFAGVLVVLALPETVSGLVASGVVGVVVEAVTYLAVLVGGVAFFLVAFRFLTPRCPLSWRDHLPGAVCADGRAGRCSNRSERSMSIASSRAARRCTEPSARSSACSPFCMQRPTCFCSRLSCRRCCGSGEAKPHKVHCPNDDEAHSPATLVITREWRNLADALDLGSSARKGVGVQISPLAPPLRCGSASDL